MNDDKVGKLPSRTDSPKDSNGDREDSPKEAPGILNKDFDRERAVAEAKMWGENWREKRRAIANNEKQGANAADSPTKSG